jgi:hypothetical protein
MVLIRDLLLLSRNTGKMGRATSEKVKKLGHGVLYEDGRPLSASSFTLCAFVALFVQLI